MASVKKLFNQGENSPMQVLADAGGKIVGRTRFQKITYLLSETGLLEGYDFEYHHYGPYSDDLSSSLQIAVLFDELNEEEKKTDWGGHYSIFTLPESVSDSVEVNQSRKEFIKPMLNISSIVLELAATAAFLAKENDNSDDFDPWGKTRELKPDKATSERLGEAKKLYKKIFSIETPRQLPNIA